MEATLRERTGSLALWDRIYALRRGWWILILCVGAAIGVAVLKIRRSAPIYQADTVVQRKNERSPLEALTNTRPTPSEMLSELELIRSAAVLAPVVGIEVHDGDAGSSPKVAQLRQGLDVTQIRGTNLIRISYRSTNPKTAAARANRIAVSYRDFSARKEKQEARQRRAFIAQQLDQVADSVRSAQDLIAQQQTAAGTLDPSDRASALGHDLLAAETEMRTLRFEESVLANLVSASDRNDTADDGMRRILVEGHRIVPALESFYARLQELQTERGRITASKFGYTREGPSVQALDSLIATTQRDIRVITEQTLTSKRTQLRAAQARITELRAQQAVLPGQASTFLRLQQRVDAAQETFDQLAEKYYEAQIAEAIESGNVEIIDAASVPSQPVSTLRYRLPIMAALLGLLLGMGIVFLIEFLNRKVRTPNEAEGAAGLPLLATIPTLKKKAPVEGAAPVAAAHYTGAAAEAFRILRTSLQMSWKQPPRVVAVTSPAPAEGKSFVSVGLAIAIAQTGKRVLLIDADLRRPTLHNLVNLSHSPGLTDALIEQTGLESAVRAVDHLKLSILTCGTVHSHPAEVLESPFFADLLVQARRDFDTVIIDTPPVLLVGESAALVRNVDAILLIARAELTDQFALEHAAARLRQVNASLLGVVLNGAPRIGGFGRYGRHYGYYGDQYLKYYESKRLRGAPADRRS